MGNEDFIVFGFEGTDDEYEDCWNNGHYTDQYCPCCPYRNECSGYEDED